MANENSERTFVNDNTNLGKATARNTRRKRKRKIGFFIMSSVLIIAALWILSLIFCRVSVISVSGTDAYTADEIIKASGIKVGMQLFSVNKKQVSENITRALSGIESVKVSFSLPNKVKLTLSEGSPKYCFETNGKLYYLSENYIALGSDITVSTDDRIYMISPEQIKRYESGVKAVMYDDDWYEILDGLAKSLELCGLSDKVTLLETKDKFDITVRYDSRIRIILGEYENIDEKLEFAKSTIDSKEINEVGTIRIKNYKMGSFLQGEY